MNYRNNGPRATMRDIARSSGFSISAVSLVLNDAPLAKYIPDQTKKRIQSVARKMGYTPNHLARALRSRRTTTIGLMVFDITDPFCTPILRGVERALYQLSHLSILTDAQNDRTRFERYLELLLERRIEGMLVIANWLLVDINLLAELKKQSVPTVVIGTQLKIDSISSVMVDNEAGGRIAMEHLYSLGHRKIAFIRGPKVLGDTAQRWRGVKSFANSVGLTVDPKLVVDLPNSFDPNHGFETGARLTDELLRRKRPFTALMAFDDITALGAMHALTKASIKIPEQCSIIGFDDVAPAALSIPPLTTVRQPLEVMGETAADIIAGAMNAMAERREFQAVQIRLLPELIVRRSTRLPSM
ncbi:MAG TPA: LacI family DNA-binding transcriptional regulator [Candidatus Angelobacter sp.]|nr:LacI family DNA-binding transcriptional regulator [Candidatus Angelobacter sp.]